VNGAEAGRRRHRRGFWVVAFAFLAVMALGTVPSPLYGLYRARDHFSLFMVTVAFAVYAIGVIGALLLGGHLSDLYGRRRLLLPRFDGRPRRGWNTWLLELPHESDRCPDMPAALVAANARASLRIPQREREAFRGR
jgi:hypothetical protein